MLNDRDLWVMYLAEQEIETDYFGIGKHRGYNVSAGVRCAMNDSQLKMNYYAWCAKKLLEKLNESP